MIHDRYPDMSSRPLKQSPVIFAIFFIYNRLIDRERAMNDRLREYSYVFFIFFSETFEFQLVGMKKKFFAIMYWHKQPVF